MIVYIFFTVALVACISCCGYFAGKVNRLEAVVNNRNTSIALQIVDLQDRMSKVEVKDEVEEDEMEERIMEKLDKKWEAGVQAVLNYDPFSGRYEE